MSETNKNEGPLQLGKDAVKTGSETLVGMVETNIDAEKKGVETIEKAAAVISEQPPIKQVKNFWQSLGPGLITGAADDDPSGVATYSQTGAKYGFGLLWLSPFTFPMMAAVQEMCARIGLVTGKGLAHNIRNIFPKWVLFLVAGLLLLANSFNIGADLGALAKATQLLLPGLQYWSLVIFFAIVCLLLQIFIPYNKYARYLKYLAVTLVVYFVAAFVIKDFNLFELAKGSFVPQLNFDKEKIILICAILGTTISPYLFFWQTSQEVEEKIVEGYKTISSRQDANDKKAIRKMRLDIWLGMLFSNLVFFFIVAVCGATLFKSGTTNITTAADAAAALKPLAGNYAYLLFALGIFGTGLLGIPVLAGSASYAVSESFGWREGLYRKFKEASAFYSIIILSVLIGLVLNFVGIDPIKALIWSAVFNGLVAPIILVLIVLISSNKKVMGEWVNHSFTKVFGWFVVGVMALVCLATIYAMF